MRSAKQFLHNLRIGRHELASAAFLTASLFVLLAGYYLLKTVREALILTEGGAEIKSYAAAGQALILLITLPVFGWIANRIKGAKLVSGTFLFFAANLGIFYAMERSGSHIAVPFYLWVGVFSVVSLSLFWGLSNDIYTQEQGRRLFPYIGIGASVGGFLGAILAKKVAVIIEPGSSMLLGALLVTIAASLLLVARGVASKKEESDTVATPAPTDTRDGFQLIASSKYLMLIAAVVVLTNVVNTTGEFIVGKSVVEASKTFAPALQRKFITSFYADYYMWVGLAGILIQTLGVAPIFKKIGVGGALLILPVVAFSGYAAMAMLPMMWLIRAAKTAENSLDYSLQNTAKHALFLPTTEAEKYKAKATIDAFFYRFGDLLQAGVVLAGSSLSFTLSDYAALNTVFALIWLAVAYAAGREYRRRTCEPGLVQITVRPARAVSTIRVAA